MEHYITEIRIDELRHLSNIVISLNPDKRQHLIITGQNGSGKTSLLLAIQKYLRAINDGKLKMLYQLYDQSLAETQKRTEDADKADEMSESEKRIRAYEKRMKDYAYLQLVNEYVDGIELSFHDWEALEALYKQGDFVTAFFAANRKTEIIQAHGVEDIRLADAYAVHEEPGKLFHKYMVHLKTQQSYAKSEGDLANAERIQKWFDRFTDALKVLLDDNTITLEYDYKRYDFKIHEKGRIPFGFQELSDGYSSVIHIVSDLILRMDRNWLLGNDISEYDVEGIVLIDELETHLHIELQKKILPFLTTFFPRIQFIVTTHSPYILNSVSNAKAYDLERCVELDGLTLYSADALAEGYFEADEYADELKQKIERYKHLVEIEEPTEAERAERARLRSELRGIPRGLSQEARDKFEEIEGQRL